MSVRGSSPLHFHGQCEEVGTGMNWEYLKSTGNKLCLMLVIVDRRVWRWFEAAFCAGWVAVHVSIMINAERTAGLSMVRISLIQSLSERFNPLTAGVAYNRVSIFY